jgi:hypothetical protein
VLKFLKQKINDGNNEVTMKEFPLKTLRLDEYLMMVR